MTETGQAHDGVQRDLEQRPCRGNRRASRASSSATSRSRSSPTARSTSASSSRCAVLMSSSSMSSCNPVNTSLMETAHHDRCGQARERTHDHRRHLSLPLRAPGQEVGRARADHSQARRRPADDRRRRPRHHDGPAPGSDPGLLRPVGEPPHGAADPRGLLQRASISRTSRSSLRTSAASRSPRSSPTCSAANLAIMHKGRPDHNVAEITHVIGEVEGQDLHHHRRHDRHRRLCCRGRQEPQEAWRRGHLRRRDARHILGAGVSSASTRRLSRRSSSPTRSPCPRSAKAARLGYYQWLRYLHMPSRTCTTTSQCQNCSTPTSSCRGRVAYGRVRRTRPAERSQYNHDRHFFHSRRAA